jgi:DNA-binding IclR family transcriptional regulator
MTDDEPRSIRAVDNAFAVVEALKGREEAGVSELARELDRSKSTVHRHLKALERHELVIERDGRYRLGLRWLDVGGAVRKRHRLYKTGKADADELAAKTGELVAVTTYEYGRSVYLYQVKGRKALTTDSHLGVRFPLHCTAAGKSMLAHFPADRVRELVETSGLPAETANTITDPDELFEALRRIRDRGVALDDEERLEGTRGIGAPILRKDTGEVLGAVAICGPPTRLQGDRFREELPQLVRETANVIEVNSTFSE